MRRLAVLAGTCCAVSVAGTGTAHAHLVTTGLGPFYDGMTHLVVSPAEVLCVVALALLAGQRGQRAGRLLVAILPAAWLVAALAGTRLPGIALWPWLGTAALLLVGLLVARGRPVAPAVVVALAVLLGALHGFTDGALVAEPARRPWLGLLGIGLAVFVIATLAAAVVVSLRPGWTRLMVRVAGSWIAAIGLLMTGWAIR